MQLIKPSVEYRDSFLSFVREFKANEHFAFYPALRDLNYEEIEQDFESFVTSLHNREQGIGLPDGYIPDTHFWVLEDNVVIGQIALRHELTEALREHGGHIGYAVRPSARGKGVATRMLELVLPEAKRMGIDRVLIGCNEENIASKRVIEKNGGFFDKEGINPENGATTLHYWIDV